MQAIGFYLALPFLYLISLLPFPVLYLLSDFICIILHYVVGYRRKIITVNLRKSFPEKSEKEIRKIRSAYYCYFCDLFLETFKTMTISAPTMLRHCGLSSPAKELFDRLYKENKSSIIVMGHYGNWEWGGNTFSIQCQQKLFVIYHPLSNRNYDRLIYRMRTRFGTGLIAMNDTFREMLSNRKQVTATAFIADQTPSPDNAYWTTFMNQDTPVFWGTEKIARKLNYPVVYVSIRRKKRGVYKMDAEILCENPASTSDGEISEMHTRRLEKDIIENPVNWLWSHRRWKHRRQIM